MHDSEERMNEQNVHVRSTTTATTTTTRQPVRQPSTSGGSSKSSSGTRMACEKASRRLRATLLKASRLGVTTADLARLPAAKRIVSQRDHDWKLAVLLLLMFGGGVIVALVCTTSRGCSKIEDINLAT
ncbi:PREDICTED: uncharacterized protein LOC105359479 [Ceratosolen solmsi marchali]|uniref:Uncharacterized protein LOC105359479 n=1 Tax=Ceratosolen solmsi marchali TaxID=326594 RepID=A0AAJ6YBR6_9HYME|nr:PREDICTED: uncharacterized protein LOC105359479 [Ceratosolen solmsi marchali]